MSLGGHKIKVVCRVRPFLSSEKADDCVIVENSNVLRVANSRDSTKEVRFSFDSCYGPDSTQNELYRKDVHPLIETIFTGTSATIFCYGVTGAGKTHTMQGTATAKGQGIIPRALTQIFKHKARDSLDYNIKLSYYEIYKEAVYDLLRPRDDTISPLSIRESADRKIFVAGLTEKQISSYDQFDSIYQRACKNRRTASTKLNNHSSRSHAILTVQVRWADDIVKDKVLCGTLHLIDLAGSEDNRKTENGKDRMAESSAINRSLFVLGQVVEALNSGAHRVPYRDSKMTRILQHSLGGDSLGMMVVNVAPGEAFLQDTNNTLNFATKSREVVNKPVVHQESVAETRWSVADRLQYHRSALPKAQRLSSYSEPANASNGKRRRSDEVAEAASVSRRRVSPQQQSSGMPQAHSRTARYSDGDKYAHQKVAAGELNPTKPRRPASSNGVGKATNGTFVNKMVTDKFNELEQRNEVASHEIMERVMRIEQQLQQTSKPPATTKLDSSAVIDLFTPATKLKTSRGWLKHARELEKQGEVEKALVHYEEAFRYAPELNKLEAHIKKLKSRIRKEKRRSSIASHGSANMVVEEKKAKDEGEEDVGALWLIDGLAESPGAEKAKRIAKKTGSAAGSVSAPIVLFKSEPKKPEPAKGRRGLRLGASGDDPAKARTNENSGPAKARTNENSGPAKARTNENSSPDTKPKANGRPKKQLSSGSSTAGSVHDRRVSFGGSSGIAFNPFVIAGNDFNNDLQRQLEGTARARKALHSHVSLKTQKLEAKSSAAAKLRRALASVPGTPGDDKDFEPGSSSSSDECSEQRRQGKARRGKRAAGALNARELLLDRRRKTHESAGSGQSLVEQFNEISRASALQMINSGDIKKIMKLQGIGKRRAEQIRDSVNELGPMQSVLELRDRLQFKNKIITGILSTFA